MIKASGAEICRKVPQREVHLEQVICATGFSYKWTMIMQNEDTTQRELVTVKTVNTQHRKVSYTEIFFKKIHGVEVILRETEQNNIIPQFPSSM